MTGPKYTSSIVTYETHHVNSTTIAARLSCIPPFPLSSDKAILYPTFRTLLYLVSKALLFIAIMVINFSHPFLSEFGSDPRFHKE
jgi:hypothetical protein